MAACRDVLAADRILLIDDRVPPFDRGAGFPRASQLVKLMAALFPEGRVTLVANDPVGAFRYAPELAALGVEVVVDVDDWEDWFASRLCHYSLVVISRAHNLERFADLIRRTQPQAAVIFDVEALFFRRLERMTQYIEDPVDAPGIARRPTGCGPWSWAACTTPTSCSA